MGAQYTYTLCFLDEILTVLYILFSFSQVETNTENNLQVDILLLEFSWTCDVEYYTITLKEVPATFEVRTFCTC